MATIAEGHELAGRYVVGHQLGVGGNGAVWAAHDRVLERTVAVKVVPDGQAAARLEREARATAGIGMPNVVGVFDVGQQDGVHFLVMEFVDGVDLATLLRATGPLDPDLAAFVGHEVARGVAAVHAASLVHRDVTPANVLVSTTGEVKLTDLGIARRTDDDATRSLTQAGTVVGTVDYLAPEQVEGRDVSAASDVYSVGLLLHTVCTGERPFGDGTVGERIARRLANGPDPLAEDLGPLAGIVATAVERDPVDRHADGEALRQALSPLVPDDDAHLRARLAERVASARAAGPQAASSPTGEAFEAVAFPRYAATSGPATTPDEGPTPAPEAVDATTVSPTAATPDQGATTVLPASGDPAAPSPDEDDTGPVEVVPAAAAAVPAAATEVVERHDQPEPAVPAAGRDGETLARPLGIAVAGVVLAVLIGSALLAGKGGDDGGGGGGGGAQPYAIAAVDDHDPLGGGGEHGDEIGRVADGDPQTAWDTEGYNSAALGGLKSGVGFLVDLGEVREVGAVELDMGLAGADVTVLVSEGRPDGDPTDGGTVLGTAEGTDGTTRVGGESVSGRWVAVWFTQLAPDGGRYRAEVAEVRVFAP